MKRRSRRRGLAVRWQGFSAQRSICLLLTSQSAWHRDILSWIECATRREEDLQYDIREYPTIDLSIYEPRNRAPVPTRRAEPITFLTCADRLCLGEHDVLQELINQRKPMIRPNRFEVEDLLKECGRRDVVGMPRDQSNFSNAKAQRLCLVPDASEGLSILLLQS